MFDLKEATDELSLAAYIQTHPEFQYLADTWDSERNKFFTLDTLPANSGRQVWWVCSRGHEHKASLKKKLAGFGKRCGACRKEEPSSNRPTVASAYKRLVSEWGAKNNISPEAVSTKSTGQFWWKCSKGHEYQMSLKHKLQGGWCPKHSLNGTSRIEIIFRDLFAQTLTNVNMDHSHKAVLSDGSSFQVDIEGSHHGIPVVVEYDGSLWHKQKEVVTRDIEKTEQLLSDGFYVIRIRGESLGHLPVTHENLLQLDHCYPSSDKMNLQLRAKAMRWLNKRDEILTPIYAQLKQAKN